MDKITKQILKEAEKQKRIIEREEKRKLKEAQKAQRIAKKQKTEADIVRQYAKIIIDKQRTRGMITNDFKHLKGKTPNKNLWQDPDFFFSVVFESYEQKYKFLDFLIQKFNITAENSDEVNIQIINGLKLAESMGLKLEKELPGDYPTGSLELREFILDNDF